MLIVLRYDAQHAFAASENGLTRDNLLFGMRPDLGFDDDENTAHWTFQPKNPVDVRVFHCFRKPQYQPNRVRPLRKDKLRQDNATLKERLDRFEKYEEK